MGSMTIARFHEMADKLREVTQDEEDILEALREIRDPDLAQLRLYSGVALGNAKALSHMLKDEAWYQENMAGDHRGELRYSRKSWRQLAGHIRHAAQHGSHLVRERSDLPLPMKLYVLAVVRTWRAVVEIDDELKQLDDQISTAA